MGTDLKPDIAVGDFDSLSEKGRSIYGNSHKYGNSPIKAGKDDSDTQSAVNWR